MEVVGVVAASLNLVEILIRSAKGLHTLNSEWKNAPTGVVELKKELEHTNDMLHHLHGILHDISTAPALLSHASLSSTIALKSQLNETNIILKELETILEPFSGDDSTKCRIRWMKCQNDVLFKRKSLKRVRCRVQESLSILNLHSRLILMRLVGPDRHVTNSKALDNNQDLSGGEEGPRPSMIRQKSIRPGLGTGMSDMPGQTILPEPSCGCVFYAQVRPTGCVNSSVIKHVFGSLTIWRTKTSKWQCQPCAVCGYKTTIQYACPTWLANRVIQSSISSGFITLTACRQVPYKPGNVFFLINSKNFNRAAQLLENGEAHVRDVETRHGNSILAATLRHATISPGFLDFLEYIMLRNPVDIHWRNNRGETPWLLAARLMLPNMPHTLASTELKDKLSQLFREPDWDRLGFTHLHRVVAGLRALNLTDVLGNPQYRSEVNLKDALGQTPLSLAATMGNTEAVDALLKAHANVDICGPDLLRKAIRSGSKGCLELLLKQTRNPRVCDSRGATLIHTVAADSNNLDLLRPLISAGVPLDSVNVRKCTPLSFTPLNDNHQVARFLLENGCNPDNMDKDGDTPLTEAIRLNAHKCLQLFIDFGVNLHTANNRGWGLLHFAGAYGDTKTLQILSTAALDNTIWEDHQKNTPQDLFKKRELGSSKVCDEFERLLNSACSKQVKVN